MRNSVVMAFLAVLVILVASEAQTVEDQPQKRVIGATAVLTEAGSGLPFAARVDTGAASCSLHVEQIEITDESATPIDNIGKPIRFQVKNEKGDTAWIETKIARVVRIRSSVQKEGESDRRYKVQLTLRWEGFSKEVLVTLNDSTEMVYPLLIGRNYLRGDFLVDVDKDNPE